MFNIIIYHTMNLLSFFSPMSGDGGSWLSAILACLCVILIILVL